MPQGIHGAHAEGTNSGYKSNESMRQIAREIEQLALQIFQQNGIDASSTPEKIFAANKEFQNALKEREDLKPLKKHGGGSITAYALIRHARDQQRKKLGQQPVNITPITAHGSRENKLLYTGEKELNNIPRGKFAPQNFAEIRDIALQNLEKLGIDIHISLVIERENFEGLPDSEEIKQHLSSDYREADLTVLSTHWMTLPGEADTTELAFLDSGKKPGQNKEYSDPDFEKILDHFRISKETTNASDFIPLIKSYVRQQIAHVNAEGKKDFVLGHCDLIRLPMVQWLAKNIPQKKRREIIEQVNNVFQDTRVQQVYTELFQAINEKEMLVEINLAGVAKKVGLYGEALLDLMKQQGVRITLATDTHDIPDEKGAQQIWDGDAKWNDIIGAQGVRQLLRYKGITEIYEIHQPSSQ